MFYVDYAVNQRLCLSKRNCLSLSERYSRNTGVFRYLLLIFQCVTVVRPQAHFTGELFPGILLLSFYHLGTSCLWFGFVETPL